MKLKHVFVPSALDMLESRIVLSKTTQGLSVVVSGLSPHLRLLNREQQALSAEINQAFTSFQNDYDQARASYFASIANQTTATTDTTSAFTDYTEQRGIVALAAVDQYLHPVAAGDGEGARPAVCLDLAHLQENHWAARADAEGFACAVVARYDAPGR